MKNIIISNYIKKVTFVDMIFLRYDITISVLYLQHEGNLVPNLRGLLFGFFKFKTWLDIHVID
ncbi:hypothetical protein BTN50_2031 [Candidatus Enterovibrio altilux]|uniref:Uncharacterized protein n=1 Tax=Candidatus Enterovibrio altilux TaxID=1927128 RepID=A0A291BBS9_9GAMM|nr:hypothetical protein BTN50_2031 [Candidatus Enterovibrio luxaltus]